MSAGRLRRDPRAEREARRVAGGVRPRFTIERTADAASFGGAEPAAGRPRRDPRAEEAAILVAGTPRRRLDRSLAWSGGPAGAGVITVAPATGGPSRGAAERPVPAAPAVTVVADPAFLVLVVPDRPGGRVSAHDRQLLGAARLLSDAGGGAVAVLDGGDGWGPLGADRVVALPPADDPAARAAAVVAAIRVLDPRHVVFAESDGGGDLARRVAAALGEPLFAGAESVSPRGLTRPARASRVEQRSAPPRLVSLLAAVVAAPTGVREARPLAVELEPAAPASAVLSSTFVPADPATVPLAEANFVVAAGNGVTDFAAFHALAAALRATPGASRVVCDAGLMPRHRQVGASGTVLDAACYFALGIAGAPQHLQGVAKCEHVVAVNTDLHAAMVERAGLAVIADAQKVMPALIAALADETGGAGSAAGAADAASWSPAAGVGGVATRADGRPLRAAVLLSAGRHPVSGRAAVVRSEAQATALVLGLGAAAVGLHAGADPAAIRDHLGHGLDEVRHTLLAEGDDPLPALAAALAADPIDLVLAGRRGQGGDDSGLVPYRLAAALGLPIVADAASVAAGPEPGTIVVEQALPRGARRRVVVRLPAVVTVHPAAPPPRPFAYGPARRGRLVPLAVAPALAPLLSLPVEEKPWRRRPRLIAGAMTGGSAEERLKAATEVSGGGRLIVDPAPEVAAAEILAFLRGIGVLG